MTKLNPPAPEVQAAQREVEALKQVIQEVEDYKIKKAELERKIDVINGLKANQRGPVQIMDQVSRALPELLWLSSLDVTPTTINLKGSAFNMSAVANFIDNLDKVDEFAEPSPSRSIASFSSSPSRRISRSLDATPRRRHFSSSACSNLAISSFTPAASISISSART